MPLVLLRTGSNGGEGQMTSRPFHWPGTPVVAVVQENNPKNISALRCVGKVCLTADFMWLKKIQALDFGKYISLGFIALEVFSFLFLPMIHYGPCALIF